jgi:hypothetical protein
MEREAELPQIAPAFGSLRLLFGSMKRGQEQTRQDADDRDDDEQFYQGEGMGTDSLVSRLGPAWQNNVHRFGESG